MKHKGYGTIVITSSLASFCGIYGLSVYSATKFALRGFAEALCMEVSEFCINFFLRLLFSNVCVYTFTLDKELWDKSSVGFTSRYRYSRIC